MRPTDRGRNVIVRKSPSGVSEDVNPSPFNARTRVHEYGGGDYLVHQGVVYFSNFLDQRLYKQTHSESIPITPPGEMRYADTVGDPKRDRLVCIREDHSNGEANVVNTIVSLKLDENPEYGTVLVQGNDFYSSPKISPDGSQLAWLTWNHPNMPWDGCELWVGELADDGTLVSTRWVAGGAAESIFQPEWSPDGVLYFASDRNGWWNLERITADGGIENVYHSKAELGMPQWVFGMSAYAFVSPTMVACSPVEQGISRLETVDLTTGAVKNVDCPFTDIQYLRAEGNQVVM